MNEENINSNQPEQVKELLNKVRESKKSNRYFY